MDRILKHSAPENPAPARVSDHSAASIGRAQ